VGSCVLCGWENFNHKGHKGNLTKGTNDIVMTENEVANRVIGLAIEVHTALGAGLLESAYKECLFYKIKQAGLFVEKEKPMPLVFESVKLECGYRLDLLVENKLVVELKSVETLTDVHLSQTLTYMRLGNYKLGLLINFNVAHLRQGIKRLINGTL
jgi:GxxExxY protein